MRVDLATTERRARGLMVVVGFVFLLPSTIYAIIGYSGGDSTPGSPWIVVPMALVIGAIHFRHSLAAARGQRPAGWEWTLLVLIAAVYLPMIAWNWNWVAMEWFVTSSAAMLLPSRIAAAVIVAVIGGTCAVAWFTAEADGEIEVLSALYWLHGMVLGLMCLYGSVRLIWLLTQLQAARTELAEVAVGRERLRVSRDLHDLLGHSLSAVSLKGDLALALLRRDPPAARAEIESLTSVARGALRDVRAVTRDEHLVSLSTEIDGAAALLSAAGVDTRLDVAGDVFWSGAAEQLLAWAVREGATNLLRHSDARSCSIVVSRSRGRRRLEIANDGAQNDGLQNGDVQFGSGLHGLTERARALSGEVTATHVGDRFRLLVEVPEETG